MFSATDTQNFGRVPTEHRNSSGKGGLRGRHPAAHDGIAVAAARLEQVVGNAEFLFFAPLASFFPTVPSFLSSLFMAAAVVLSSPSPHRRCFAAPAVGRARRAAA